MLSSQNQKEGKFFQQTIFFYYLFLFLKKKKSRKTNTIFNPLYQQLLVLVQQVLNLFLKRDWSQNYTKNISSLTFNTREKLHPC